jgi:uncharacterized membrane protein YsdA (DUF1294 family)
MFVSLLTLIFIISLLSLALIEKIPFLIVWIYCLMSIFTFGTYALDKSAARRKQRRIRENILHSLSLLGGWPGAVIAQRFLNHKSRKQSFQIMFLSTIALNLVATGWLVFK